VETHPTCAPAWLIGLSVQFLGVEGGLDGEAPWVRHRPGSLSKKQVVAPRASSQPAPSSPRLTPPWQSARSG